MSGNWVIVALAGALTLSLITVVTAQDTSTTNVEVRVWQSTQDAERVYISARPEGGRWGDTLRLDMSDLNSRGTYRYSDTMVAVPMPELTPGPAAQLAPGSTITFTVRTPPTSGKSLIIYAKPDHAIQFGGLQVELLIRDSWQLWPRENYLYREFAPGVEHHLRGMRGVTWEDATAARARTLDGRTVRNWECSDTSESLPVERRFTCIVADESVARSLRDAEDPDMWIVVDGKATPLLRFEGDPEVETRLTRIAGARDLGMVYVYLSRDDMEPDKLGSARSIPANRTYGSLLTESETPNPAASFNVVAAFSGELGSLRCELHNATTNDRAVWACDTW